MKSTLLTASLLLTAWGTHAQTAPNTSEYAEPAFRSPVVAVEFTGQRCRYCPNMSRALKSQEEKYGKENYIITALHNLEGFSILPSPHVSLFHPEAKEYAASIKVHSGLPQLVYNTLGPTVSDNTLEEKFKEDDLLECTGKVMYNENKEYVIDLQTRLRRNQIEVVKDKKIDILFWAMENDIVALQDDNGKWTYPAHQHIFRGSINTTWGESYEIGTAYQKTFKIPEAVSNPENTEIVVFFFDHDTRTVLDAARFAVTKQDITGISNSVSDNANKNTYLYDLNGRAVNQPKKGEIYIQNGKKFIKN